MRMVQGGCRARVAMEALDRGVIAGEILGQELESDVAPEAQVLGLVDNSHASAAKLAEHAIVRDRFADHTVGDANGCAIVCQRWTDQRTPRFVAPTSAETHVPEITCESANQAATVTETRVASMPPSRRATGRSCLPVRATRKTSRSCTSRRAGTPVSSRLAPSPAASEWRNGTKHCGLNRDQVCPSPVLRPCADAKITTPSVRNVVLALVSVHYVHRRLKTAMSLSGWGSGATGTLQGR